MTTRSDKVNIACACTSISKGRLTDAQREALKRAAAACPIHKLMTRAEITIETADP